MRILNKSKIILSAVLLLVLTAGLFGQTVNLPKGVTFVTSVEGANEYRLENGLQVILLPDPTRQDFAVNLVYHVGSRHEGYGETGMAHLLEHMNFKGTPTHPKIMDELTERGAMANATTWYDRTNYFEVLPASESNLEWSLSLEADRMINSYIARKDLDSEFSVVRNEMESGENSPSGILAEKVMATAYQWHNYGKTTIGARSDVELVKIENLQAFYHKYYQPDNATLIVAGKFDEAKALDIIQQKFGSIPRPTRKLEPTWTIEPVQDGERHVVIRRVGENYVVMAGYHMPPAAHPDYVPVQIMIKLLADAPSGKLYKALVETKKTSGVNGDVYLTKEPSYALFGAEVTKGVSAEETLKTLTDTIESFAQTPPSKEDIARHVNAELTGLENIFNNTTNLGLSFTEYVGSGDWRLLYLKREALKKVTPEDIQRVAKKYLLQSNRTSGIFIPSADPVRAEIPRLTEEEILAIGNSFKSDAKVTFGEAFDATPSNVENRAKRSQIGNLKVALLAKKNRGETVFFSLRMNIGNLKDLMNRGKIGDLTASLLMSGTVNKTRQQIKDELTSLKAEGGVGGNATSVNATFQTTKQNLPALLKLVAEILKQPAFPESELELKKQEQLSSLQGERTDPGAIGSRELDRVTSDFAPGDPRYASTLDEDIASVKAVTVKDIKAFYNDFYGMSSSNIAIVGDFDEKAVNDILTQSFANWKSAKPYERITNNRIINPSVNKAFNTPDKANAVFMTNMQVKLGEDNPDYPSMLVANYILGEGMLNSRLAKRIRQKEGISYSVGSSFGAYPLEEKSSFGAFAIFAPENLDRLEKAFNEEMTRVINEGFTAEEVDSAKKALLETQKTSLTTDGAITSILVDSLHRNRPVTWLDKFEKSIESVTLDQVNASAKKYFDLKKMTIIKVGDFNKGKKAQ